MDFKTALKNVWEAVAYGPSDPIPAVKKQLEDKGYKFKYESQVGQGIPAGFMGVRASVGYHYVENSFGRRVLYADREDAHSVQYRKDYKDAMAAYKARPHGGGIGPY